MVMILVVSKEPTPPIESVDPELSVNQRFPSYKHLVNCPDSQTTGQKRVSKGDKAVEEVTSQQRREWET
jgi:hypothetical protein